MSTTGSNNVLIGASSLPHGGGSRQIVLGTEADILYLAGASIHIGSGGVALEGNSALVLNPAIGAAGFFGQVFTSGGQGAAPKWSEVFPYTTSATIIIPYQLFTIYELIDQAGTWVFTLPAPATNSGSGAWIKNFSSYSGTVGNSIVLLGGRGVAEVIQMQPGDSGYFISDGNRWYNMAASEYLPAPPPIVDSCTLTSGATAQGPVSGGTAIAINGR